MTEFYFFCTSVGNRWATQGVSYRNLVDARAAARRDSLTGDSICEEVSVSRCAAGGHIQQLFVERWVNGECTRVDYSEAA